MTPKEMALEILNDPDLDRRDRRIRALLARQQEPLSDSVARAIITAGKELGERGDEWYAAISQAHFGRGSGADRSVESWMGRLVSADLSNPNDPAVKAQRQRTGPDCPTAFRSLGSPFKASSPDAPA